MDSLLATEETNFSTIDRLISVVDISLIWEQFWKLKVNSLHKFPISLGIKYITSLYLFLFFSLSIFTWSISPSGIRLFHKLVFIRPWTTWMSTKFYGDLFMTHKYLLCTYCFMLNWNLLNYIVMKLLIMIMKVLGKIYWMVIRR